VLLDWGSCGRLLYVDGAPAGFALYAPPAYLAGNGFVAVSKVSPDAVLLMTARVLPEFAGMGHGRVLVQSVVKDLTRRRGVRAVEAFGDVQGREGNCVIPADFLTAVGFKTVQPHPRYPRLRIDLRSVLSRSGDAQQRLEVPGLGDPADPPRQIVSRAQLTEIMRPRVEEIFQLVRARLEASELPLVGRRLVLTGGGSALEGVVELAEEIFGMPARAGRALPLDGRLEVAGLPGATTAAGLLRWASQDDGGLTFWSPRPNRVISARLAKISQWLRENF